MKINNQINTLKGTREIERLLFKKVNYHKNMVNPPLDSLPVKDVKSSFQNLKEVFQKEIKEVQGEIESLPKFNPKGENIMMFVPKEGKWIQFEFVKEIFKNRFGDIK